MEVRDDFCVICGETFRKGDKIIYLRVGEIVGETGKNKCFDDTIYIHYLCMLGMIETIKSIEE